MSGLVVKTDAGVGRIRLNLPEQGNRISQEVVVELGKQLAALASNRSLKTVVISAEGEHFCMGRAPGQKPANINSLQGLVGKHRFDH